MITEAARRPSFDVYDIRVNAMTIAEYNEFIAASIEQGENRTIASVNLHTLYLYHHDPRLREFFSRVDLVHIDGTPIVWLAQFRGHPVRQMHRVAVLDWIGPFLERAAARGWRIFYLGSAPGVAARGADKLREQYPGLQIETAHGFIDCAPYNQSNAEVLEKIRAFQPNLLMVGMGQPRQEQWILQNLGQTGANITITTGACIEYIAGEIKIPPRWLGTFGLEWAYRFVGNPGRLWYRYLIEPWFVLRLIGRRLLTGSPRPLPATTEPNCSARSDAGAAGPRG